LAKAPEEIQLYGEM